MRIIGGDFLQATLREEGYFLKAILNQSAVHFFVATTEHRDATQPGLRYDDESQGNALAATIKPERIDIRGHDAYSEGQVTAMMRTLLNQPEAQCLKGFTVYYRGQRLDPIP